MRLFTGYTGRNFEHVENLGRVPTRVLDTAVPISIHTAVLRELVRMRNVFSKVFLDHFSSNGGVFYSKNRSILRCQARQRRASARRIFSFRVLRGCPLLRFLSRSPENGPNVGVLLTS